MRRLLLRIFGVLPEFARSAVVRVLYPTFTAGTAVVCRNPDGEVLLVTQSYTPDWNLPGGMMERAEQPHETAERELREELGLHVTDLETQRPLVVRSRTRVHLTFVYTVDLDPGTAAAVQSADPVEITGTGWFRPDALPPLHDDTELFLAHLAR